MKKKCLNTEEEEVTPLMRAGGVGAGGGGHGAGHLARARENRPHPIRGSRTPRGHASSRNKSLQELVTCCLSLACTLGQDFFWTNLNDQNLKRCLLQASIVVLASIAISLERERIARTQFAHRERHEVMHLHVKRGLMTCSVRCVTSILCAFSIRTVAVSR